MILPGIPPSYLTKKIFGEYISYFIQPFLFLTVLCHSCNETHFMTNTFEKISVSCANPEGHPIVITCIVHLTADHLLYDKIKPKNLLNSTIVSTIFIDHYSSQIKLVISAHNISRNFIEQLLEHSYFTCKLFFNLHSSKSKYMLHGWMVGI